MAAGWGWVQKLVNPTGATGGLGKPLYRNIYIIITPLVLTILNDEYTIIYVEKLV